MKTPEQLASGRWKVRFRHNRRETSETFDTKKEALRFAKLLDALGPQGALDAILEEEQAADVPTLDQLAADHIEHLTGVEDGTRVGYQRLWDRTWSKHFGRVPANQLSTDDVRRAVNKLAESYSKKSLENQRGLLSGVLGRAVELGYLPKNPAKGVRLPRTGEHEKTEMRILTPDEFARTIALVHPHYQAFVRFMAGTGVRWGEAVALQVRDLALGSKEDVERGYLTPTVRIRRALKWHPTGERVVGVPKTSKSRRTVVIPPVLVDELRDLVAGRKSADLVFTAPRGGQILHRTFWSRVWLPAVGAVHCKKHRAADVPDPKCTDCRVGLEPRPRIHDLRHSHASTLLAAGVPIHVVQARLGHESIQTTVDTYGHLLPDAQLLAAKAADLVFTGPSAARQLAAAPASPSGPAAAR